MKNGPEKILKSVTLYTDGACSGNPGPGGWAAILIYNGHEKVLSGGEETTTNNRMELLAVINGLGALKERCRVTVFSDSQYVVNAVTKGWLEGWRLKGWKRREGELKNPELWQRLYDLLREQDTEFFWVRGHEDDELNNRCDKIAVAERSKFIKV